MWLVMEIGCLECGMPSGVVGVFADKDKAEAVATACEKGLPWRGGENTFKVFELPQPEIIGEQYRAGSSNDRTTS